MRGEWPLRLHVSIGCTFEEISRAGVGCFLQSNGPAHAQTWGVTSALLSAVSILLLGAQGWSRVGVWARMLGGSSSGFSRRKMT